MVKITLYRASIPRFLLLECAKCSYTVDVEETEIISRMQWCGKSHKSVTDVYIQALLSSFPTGITCSTKCAKDY